jgi:hypothetical protein
MQVDSKQQQSRLCDTRRTKKEQAMDEAKAKGFIPLELQIPGGKPLGFTMLTR